MSNLQHVVAENVGPPLGFTIVTNPTYNLPPDYAPQQVEIPTQPQSVHIPTSNEVPMVQKEPIVQMMKGILSFKRNVPISKGAHLMTKLERSQVAEAA